MIQFADRIGALVRTPAALHTAMVAVPTGAPRNGRFDLETGIAYVKMMRDT
jgi:hypothetical protein